VLSDMLADAGPQVIGRIIADALAGSSTAQKILIERLMPRAERRVAIELPDIEGPEGACKAMSAVVVAVAAGEISVAEAAELVRVIEAVATAAERA
jgi:hypothetical protein